MHDTRSRRRSAVAAVALSGLAACASSTVAEIDGRWEPVNRYAEHTQAIPLRPANVFRPAPMDGTLRAMLLRWSREGGLALAYRHSSDFLLHARVAGIASTDLDVALTQLADVFAAEGVGIARLDGRIVVEARGASLERSADAGLAAAADGAN